MLFFLFRIFHASQFKSTPPLLLLPHHILETGSPWFDLLHCLVLWVCLFILSYWSSSGCLYSSLKTRNGLTLSSQCWLWENKNLCFSGYLSIKKIFFGLTWRCKTGNQNHKKRGRRTRKGRFFLECVWAYMTTSLKQVDIVMG